MNYISALIDAILTSGITIPAIMIGFYLSQRYITYCLIPMIIFGFIDHFLVKALYIVKSIGSDISAIKNYTWLDALTAGIVPDILAFIIVALVFFFLSKALRKFIKI